jgi:hypothetical protein
MLNFRARRTIQALALLCIPIAASAQFAGHKAVPSDVKKGFDAITVSDAKQWLGYLAGPECMGRGTGQPGFQKAADYVAARFKEFGLKPIGDNGTYFQGVPFLRYRLDPNASFISNADGTSRASAGKSFNINSNGGAVNITAPVVFVRAKGNASIPNPDALKGRIVVVFSDGGQISRRLRQDLFRAQPALVLNVQDKLGEATWSVRRGKLADFKPSDRASSGSISANFARQLMQSQGIGAEFMSANLAPDTMEIGQGSKDLKISVKAQVEEVSVPNVVAVLEGSDPVLRNEYVAVGSHLDHMGTDGTTTWWGADDDGSGSTGVIGVAKAFATNGVRPKRSVLFMTFCGEEMGLIGSAYFVQNPLVPLDKIQCLMQMDMVGRDSFGAQNGDQKRIDKVEENRDTMRLVGSKRISQELHDVIEDVNQHIGFKFKYDAEDVYTRSDHYNFARNGIPIAFQFCGFTPDYHQPTDTVEKINFDKVTNAAKLSYLTLMKVANMDGKLKRNGAGD